VQILGTEGADSKDWILIDAGDVIINIMSEDSREHYDLESLWDRSPK
jgi:ribosome-associated protein